MTTPAHEKVFASDERIKLPRPFILRRLHSLLGIWLVIYLCEHLLVNAQMALYFQNDGSSFVSMVNAIHNLPFLQVVEVVFLGLPFLIHGYWGVVYARTAKSNAHRTNGAQPALPQYKRNKAYTWQRITAWLLIVGIIAHVIQMRFLHYPALIYQGDQRHYLSNLTYDPGLALAAQKLNVTLYSAAQIQEKERLVQHNQEELEKLKPHVDLSVPNTPYFHLLDAVEEGKEWVAAAHKKSLKQRQVLAVAPSAGASIFLSVRQTFASPLMVVLYSLLVIAATYHAFNGMWTFMISWGVTLSRRSQKTMRTLTSIFMAIVILLGLMAVWGAYWTTL